MTSDRFVPPVAGVSIPVRFPAITRDELSNGLAVWAIPQPAVPVVTAVLVVRTGTVNDPSGRPGLASLTGDLLDEGAGPRGAIELTDALGRLGAELDVDVGPDATLLSVRALSRSFAPALEIVANVVSRPRLAEADFQRVRELRIGRLRQLSRSAGAPADRAFVSALFGDHPYGHGALGTTASLEATTLDDARRFWETLFGPTGATLIVGGAIAHRDAHTAASRAFGRWSSPRWQPQVVPATSAAPDPRVVFVDRPGAPQVELRLGHVGPGRQTEAYHVLLTLNALLGGQFTSRINRRLRQEKGVTYGARTSFDFRRLAGTFSCETNVDTGAAAEAVADVLQECAAVGRAGAVAAEELDRAKASLTRGYVRHFETAAQLVRAAAQLATYSLDEDTFDRFVGGVEAVTPADVSEAAARFVRPEDMTIVVVGDAGACRARLDGLGRPVVEVTPAF